MIFSVFVSHVTIKHIQVAIPDDYTEYLPSVSCVDDTAVVLDVSGVRLLLFKDDDSFLWSTLASFFGKYALSNNFSLRSDLVKLVRISDWIKSISLVKERWEKVLTGGVKHTFVCWSFFPVRLISSRELSGCKAPSVTASEPTCSRPNELLILNVGRTRRGCIGCVELFLEFSFWDFSCDSEKTLILRSSSTEELTCVDVVACFKGLRANDAEKSTTDKYNITVAPETPQFDYNEIPPRRNTKTRSRAR